MRTMKSLRSRSGATAAACTALAPLMLVGALLAPQEAQSQEARARWERMCQIRAEKFDLMVVTTGTRRVWPVTGIGPLTDKYSLTSDWDNQWLSGGTEDDVIKEAHLDEDSIFNAVKRFADDRSDRMSKQAAAFNGHGG